MENNVNHFAEQQKLKQQCINYTSIKLKNKSMIVQ